MVVISASDAYSRGKFDDEVAKRHHFSINDIKYTTSRNSCDVTRGTKKTFQG